MAALQNVKFEDWLKIAPLLGTFVAFVAAVVQYMRSERWKRIEFVGESMRNMKSDAAVINVTTMLDWANRSVRLFPEREEEAKQWVMVTHADVAKALRPADEHGFTDVEARIREQFDVYFDYLERFYQFVKGGLIPAKAFQPLLQYWIDLISQPREPLIVKGQSAIWTYLQTYGFVDARAFLRKLGAPIP